MAASIDTAVSHCDSLATNTAASLKTPLLCDLRQLALKRRQFLVTMAPLTRQRIVPQQPAFIAPTATLTSTDASSSQTMTSVTPSSLARVKASRLHSGL